MSSYKPSCAFEQAVAFLSNVSNLTSMPDSTKLELYGLFKLLTVSPEPPKARPSIFFLTERAKWDAWKSAGLAWRGNEPGAEERYTHIAQSLGWRPDSTEPSLSAPFRASPSAEELLAEESNGEQSGGSGLGLGVSTMQTPTSEQTDESTLHGLAIDGNVQKLRVFLDARSGADVDELDEFGYTALHLACDRGNASLVELLLKKGADVSIKDEDGLSALDLARAANHKDIVVLLETHLKA